MKTTVLAPALLVSLVSLPAFAADELKSPPSSVLGYAASAPDQAAQDNQPTSAPSGAPAAGATGGVTLSLPSSSTTAPPADKAAEEKKPEKSWIDDFAGSSVFTQVSMNWDVVNRQANPGAAPTVDNWTRFSPRYNLSKAFQLRGLVSLNTEFTDNFNTGTTTKREPVLSDTTIQLFYRGIPAIADKHIKFQPFVGVGLPTSKASRARTTYFTPSIGLQTAYMNDHLFGGEFLALAIATYGRPIYASQTGQLTDPVPYDRSCLDAASNSCSLQSTGVANVRDQLSFAFIVAQDWGKWSPGLFYRQGHAFMYKFNGILPPSTPQGSPGVRNDSYFAAWLDYHLNDWLTPELGYQMPRSMLAADGTYGNPIFSTYQDWRLYIGANIQLDSLYKSIIGTGGEAGVVRAKNTHNPIMFQ